MVSPTRLTPEIVDEYVKKGYWNPEECVSDMWLKNAREFPDREAMVDAVHRFTWGEVGKRIQRLALYFLEIGMKPGELVIALLPNSAELAIFRNASERAGMLCMPALHTLRHTELEHILNVTQATAIAVPVKFRDFDFFQMAKDVQARAPSLKHIFVIRDPVPPGAISVDKVLESPLETRYPADRLEKTKCKGTDISLLVHTTGTTGLPKIVEYPVCTMVYSAKVHVQHFKLSKDDIIGVFGPAPAGANALAYLGIPRTLGKVVMVERFEAGDALRLIEKEKITVAAVVPALLAMMLKHPEMGKHSLKSLRYINSFGAFLDYSLAVEVEEKFGCPIVQMYGSNDSGPLALTGPDESREVRLKTVGRPRGGGEVRLLDDNGKEVGKGEIGEIVVRGPILASGFYRNPEATWQTWTKDGWFKTGDLGRIDAQGNLLIAGRKKEMIIRGGQNVYPIEIEGFLVTHPKVGSVAIVGMPDPVMGEKACAYIVPKAGEKFTFDEMVNHLKVKKVASYKIPERLEIVDALPLVGGQKVDKKALQKDILAKLKAEGQVA